jgi:hypothetical protein
MRARRTVKPVRPLLVVVAALVVTGSASAADGEPRRALTKKDQATARSIVLKRADLGAGFVARKRTDDDRLPKGVRCGALDESDLTVTGDAESADFQLANGPLFVTVGSTAQVYRTLREANASLRRGTSTQTATCLADIVRLSAPAGQKITVVSSKRVAFPELAPKATAFRLVLTIAVGDRQVRAYVDAVVLQHGRYQSGLLFTSIGTPVGRADQVALASVVAKRLAKATGGGGPVA